MIQYHRTVLANGLRVLIHEDHSTPMAAINVLYDVGSRDENPSQTGLAHLFEHLMFSGSATVPDFDEPVQRAGGENNAFTNADATNFHITLPAHNLEVALWLESDRMRALRVNAKNLNTQRKVVLEEFQETCMNEPYGDVWHHLSALIYEQHPYRWPVIGLSPSHIEQVQLKDVQAFYKQHYIPANAILTICGHIDTTATLALVQKWFENIPSPQAPIRNLTPEPQQTALRRKTVVAEVPVDALYMAFVMAPRLETGFYAADLLSDVLAYGPSSRLNRKLVKENPLFSTIDAYVSANLDAGILLIEGRPADGVTLEAAEAAVWLALETLQNELIEQREFEKLLNKVESNFAFSEGGALNKAINLSFFELLGQTELVNNEMDSYRALSPEILKNEAITLFSRKNASVLQYVAMKK